MTESAAPREWIVVEGAREHNLQDIDVRIPRDALVVITGLSGSGKSSLAFDTLYAEGQRRYVESLSAYARQFLDQMNKPDADTIDGLSPAIAIEQKTTSKNPRSTVGTVTEIYDHLRLLFARAGDAHCPNCEQPIASQTLSQMSEHVLTLPEGTRVQVLAPVVRGRKGEYKKELELFRRQGFVRVRIDGDTHDLGEEIRLDKRRTHDIDVVVDRLAVKPGARSRITESIETAARLADGLVKLDVINGEEQLLSESNACIDCGISLPELAPRLFSFNSPHGACARCDGIGQIEELDPERFVPDPSLSVADGAIAPWQGRRNRKYYRGILASLAEDLGFDLDTPWCDLEKDVQRALLLGTGDREIEFVLPRGRRRQKFRRTFDGVLGDLERKLAEDPELALELAPFGSPHPCPECDGTRLRKEARSVRIGGETIAELASRDVASLRRFLDELELSPERREIADRILREVADRLRFLSDVGLHYLTLDRPSVTLSGGEGQRIRLATQIGASLMGVLYILDEPSIGLHARDNQKLLESLKRLRKAGNSVLVVEHDEATVRAADHVIDMGPGAGRHGGRIVAEGTPEEIAEHPESPTGAYLSGRAAIAVPAARRPVGGKKLRLEGCREHNLKNVAVDLPLGCFIAVTGVSGSGKSTLINDTLYRALAQRLYRAKDPPGRFRRLSGAQWIDKVIDVNQAPIGRTPRSNPATYTGAFGAIRELFRQVPEARARGYGPGRFSFNVKGGRCESCQGDGLIRIEMHFLPDIYVTCEVCNGRRYNRETLEITYKGQSIADVLEMTVSEAAEFMANIPSIKRPLETLDEVGLGYIHLGQPATTLSGGEAQRVKLAKELARRSSGSTLYILDEPTTGLHFADIDRLLQVLQRLVERGNTVVVIEHQLDIIKCADHVIDLGPEGGDSGGHVVVAGTPEDVAACPQSYTGRALAEVLS